MDKWNVTTWLTDISCLLIKKICDWGDTVHLQVGWPKTLTKVNQITSVSNPRPSKYQHNLLHWRRVSQPPNHKMGYHSKWTSDVSHRNDVFFCHWPYGSMHKDIVSKQGFIWNAPFIFGKCLEALASNVP